MLRRLDFSVSKEEFSELKKITVRFVDLLKEFVRKELDAEVFLGGSFAKGTLAKSDEYDADIFVRFDWKYERISDLLEKVLKKVARAENLKLERLHGSRDYFRIRATKNLTFEIIPVKKIKRVKEAQNVTDLSYFHVNYVRKRLNEKLRRELYLTKKFFKANGVYGAESYIHGFSGYGLECLVIYYKGFEKILKELLKISLDERKVIDPQKFYKKKNEVFFALNESKLQSPLILIDPTWKERNVFASLSRETFVKFQEVARKFLKNPSEAFFYKGNLDEEAYLRESKRKGAEFVAIDLETERQGGDIAGTKMKKFFVFVQGELRKYFDVLNEEFYYDGGGQRARGFLILRSKKEVLKIGPPVEKEKEAKLFKTANPKSFVEKGRVYSRMKFNLKAKEFLTEWINRKEGKIKLKEMGISKLKVS